MKNLISNIKKQILPISILLGCIVLGSFLYSGITERQNSINVQERMEYIGKRKMECYEIFEREKSKEKEQHNSVTGVQYYEPSNNQSNDFNDVCRVEYKYVTLNSDNKTEIVTEYKSY